MTPEERRKRPEHHVVHDYANLVSSWRLREPHHVAELMRIPTANGHAWHAFSDELPQDVRVLQVQTRRQRDVPPGG